MMRGIILVRIGFALVLPLASVADDSRYSWPSDYDNHVAHWKEIPLMLDPPPGWEGKANALFPSLSWHVFLKNGEIAAHGSSSNTEDRDPQPSFKPKLIENRPYAEDASWVALKVNDGWLVAFDIGEWGGALVWFNSDGTAERKISDDQLNCFAQTPDGIFACGNTFSIAMFKIDRDRSGVWRIQEVCKLPYSEVAIGWLGKHKLLVVSGFRQFIYSAADGLGELSDGLLPSSLGVQKPCSLCRGRYALSSDKLFTAENHYVTEFDLHTAKRRYLVPDERFTNEFVRWEASCSDKHDREEQRRRSSEMLP